MNIIASLIPIIILLVVVVSVFLVVFKVKRIPMKTNKYSYVNRVKLMFGGYMALLIISVGIFYMLPIDSDAVTEGADIVKEESLYNRAENGMIETVDRSYRKQTWEFTIEGNEINLRAPNNRMSIYVEVKKEMNNKVKTAFYQSPVVIDGIDLTDRMNVPHITFSSDNMTVTEPKSVEIKYTAFKESFVTRQVTGERWIGDRSLGLNEQLLYIQIPYDIDLNYDPGVFVKFVGEGGG
ncbi:hypothetical protein [Virgibacillus litoralis]|uniref:DUF2140 domain-containing protein n=1 Tax=Virgibacillus litoralis TaxID=578221 RepID=A0ABS4HGW6_9BACI|nr:hypothetical protein [Virgibacillus litoralis]MBP1950170.1 hypothetical protein [Virgibacillus litoralis]